MNPYTAYALAWASTALATSVGVYVTGSALPLFALALPLFISVSRKD